MSLVLLSLAHAGLLDDIYAGTGYTAQDLCTRVYVSGDDSARVLRSYIAPEVQPLPPLLLLSTFPDRVSAVTIVPGHGERQTSYYRRGLGCTLIPPGTDPATVLAQPFVIAAELPPSDAPWPTGEGGALSASDSLERAASLIFGAKPTSPGQTTDVTAFLVAKDGKLVYERYGKAFGRENPQLGWSMTKSLTAMIAGLFAMDGRIDIDAPVGLPAWQGSPKAAIAWHDLFDMSAGLQWNEGYGGASDVTQQLYAQADQGAWSASLPLVAAPGTVFNYSTGLPSIAMLRMRQLLGGEAQDLYDFYQRRLFRPLGIRGGVIEPDASGTPAGGSYGVLRPVDWLRLGELLAEDGQWNGKTLLSPEWVRRMRTPSPSDPSYGGSVWFPSAVHLDPALQAKLPADTFFFWGHLGQFLVVSPSAHLVVLRMGVTHGDDEPILRTLFSVFGDLAERP